VPRPAGLGSLDAIERRWPGLYDDGAGIGRLVSEFAVPNEAQFEWRLYELRTSR
jgi:hypothetical protein